MTIEIFRSMTEVKFPHLLLMSYNWEDIISTLLCLYSEKRYFIIYLEKIHKLKRKKEERDRERQTDKQRNREEKEGRKEDRREGGEKL